MLNVHVVFKNTLVTDSKAPHNGTCNTVWTNFCFTEGYGEHPPASEEGVQEPRKIPRRHSHMAEDQMHAHTHRTRMIRVRPRAECCEHVAETVTDSGREGKPIQEGVGGRHRECDFGFLCWGACWCQKWMRMRWRERKTERTTGRQDRSCISWRWESAVCGLLTKAPVFCPSVRGFSPGPTGLVIGLVRNSYQTELNSSHNTIKRKNTFPHSHKTGILPAHSFTAMILRLGLHPWNRDCPKIFQDTMHDWGYVETDIWSWLVKAASHMQHTPKTNISLTHFICSNVLKETVCSVLIHLKK